MRAFLFHILKLNMIAAAAVALVLLISGVRKNKYSARWKYDIWLVISVMLLVPVQPVENALWNVRFTSKDGVQPVTTGNMESDSLESGSPWNNSLKSGGAKTVAIPWNEDLADRILQGFLWIWLGGAVLLAVGRTFLYHFSLQNLQRWAVPVTDQRVKSLYRSECRKKKIKNPPKLMRSSRLTSPVLVGLFHTRLYYIDSEYSMEELQFVFSHELSHYRSKDLWYKMLLLIVTTLYWFNPFLHLMLKEADKDIENLRDSSVVKACDPGERKQYQFLLLKTAVSHELRVPYLSASLNDSAQVFQDRILYMRNQRFLKKGILPAVLITALMLFFNVAVGAAAQEAENPGAVFDQNGLQQSELPEALQSFAEPEDAAADSSVRNAEEPVFTGGQITLYTPDYYSANYVYKATDGNWYDGSGRVYVQTGENIWESQEDGSEWTNTEPESVAENASAQVRIVDEEGLNGMTIYQDGETGVWRNIARGVFTSVGNDTWRAMDGNLWYTVQ